MNLGRGRHKHSDHNMGSSLTTLKLRHDMLYPRPSLIAQLVKNLLAMQETLVQFLGQEDPLEKG